ncbi:MAG TPA: dipeptide epimerase [Saprospiraceae bacterium]|nr:dipeptide epimerase [Saprospiraceae bacterium]HMQ81534.1 dipeptide epimerase [Saprospiraceae bacterium]
MQLIIHTFELQLRHTFAISHESRKVMPSLIVELRQDGHSGFGEATETRYYGIHLNDMVAKLEALRPTIENMHWDLPEVFWEKMRTYLPDDPFILCALDQAAHDLYGKLLGKNVYQRWGLDLHDDMPLSNYTIGIAPIEEMVAKMEEMPWPIYKIKLGTDRDLEIIQTLRKHSDAIFRVDANTAWSVEQTLEIAPYLRDLGVEFIEQPLKANNWEGMKQLYGKCVLPIMADESCHIETDVARCYGFFDGVNVKLMKCGGLTPALRMVKAARMLGLKVMTGCMTESSVGISAIAQLLPLLDYVDMDGALLLSNDPATGVEVTPQGAVFPSSLKGTGAGLRR